jgi:hypothetical protein
MILTETGPSGLLLHNCRCQQSASPLLVLICRAKADRTKLSVMLATETVVVSQLAL